GPGKEISLRRVVAGERMRPLDDPVDVVVDMLEEARAVALLETSENLPDVVLADHRSLPRLPVERRNPIEVRPSVLLLFFRSNVVRGVARVVNRHAQRKC